jgi:hypothetical protein
VLGQFVGIPQKLSVSSFRVKWLAAYLVAMFIIYPGCKLEGKVSQFVCRPVRMHLQNISHPHFTKQKWLNNVSRMEDFKYPKELLSYRPIRRRREEGLDSH